MKKRVAYYGALLLMVSLIASACGPAKDVSPAPDGTAGREDKNLVYEQLELPVETIDPAYVQNESEIMVAKLLFLGLVKESLSGETVPCIARSWEVSADKRNYIFHLNKRVLFHNGKEITAGDFKFSWERVLRLNAPSAYLFANIQGADEVLSGREKLASGIVAVDNYTLSVTLVHPQENFVASLIHPAGAVLDRYEVVEQGVNFARPGTLSQPAPIPSGTGPFRLMEWIDGRNLTLGRNDLYFGGKPALERIKFILDQPTADAALDFIAGKIHLVQDVTERELPPLPDQCPPPSVSGKPVREFRYVGINANLAPFKDKTIRDAVLYGLNPADILQAARGKSGGEILSGYLTDYWYGQSVQEKTYYNFNRELGAGSLDLSGHPGGVGLPEITLYCGSTEEDKTAAQEIVANLAALGFKMKVQAVDAKDLRRMIKNGEAPIYTATFTAKSPELDVFFQEQIDSRWQKSIVNPLWDQLLETAGQEDKTTRLNMYRQLESEVIGDSRIRYLYTYKSATAVSDQIENFQLAWGNNILFENIRIKNR